MRVIRGVGVRGIGAASVAVYAALGLALLPRGVVRGEEPAGDASAPTEFGVRGDAVEVTSAGSETTKRFRLPDGSFAEVATGRPSHIRDAAGRWRNSRARLTPGGDELVTDSLPFSVRVLPDGVAIGARDESRGIVLLSEGRSSTAGTHIASRLPRGPLDWNWDLGRTELKLTSAPIPRSLGVREYDIPYRLWGGLSPPVFDAQDQLTSDEFVFGRPFVLGADGESYDVVRWVTRPDAAALALRVDDRRLPRRAYPYRIDD